MAELLKNKNEKMITLKEFTETYFELEEKALEIMKIYGIGDYNLDGISFEEYKGKTQFNIKASIYYSGGGVDYEWLSFDLEEMNNDINYFKTKYKKKVEKEELNKKLAKKKEAEDRRLQKEAKDKAEYIRLKAKFEENA